jgi:dUTP pyrophosphatase
MNRLVIGFKKLPNCLGIPEYATEGASGLDLHAATSENLIIQPFERALVPTGIVLELPNGYEGQIRSRSGLALEYGLTVLNGVGTIDSDYYGELKVILINLGSQTAEVRPGQRIAQLVIVNVTKVELNEVGELKVQGGREDSGFGSTGT